MYSTVLSKNTSTQIIFMIMMWCMSDLLQPIGLDFNLVGVSPV